MLKIWKIQVIIDTLKREEEETSSFTLFMSLYNAATWRYAVDFLGGIISVSLGPPTRIL